MGFRISRCGVVQVVRGQERDSQLLRDAHEVRHDPLFNAQAVIHDLDKVVFRPKDVAEFRSSFYRLVILAKPQPGLNLTAGASCGRDNTGGIGLE